MIPATLQDLMRQHNIIVSVVANTETGEKIFFGDRTALDSDYVIRTTFDDLSAQELEEYLKDMILPQMIQQGRVCALMCKPNEHTIVGLFCHDERDVLERYHSNKIIDSEVKGLWARSARD